MRSLFAVLLVVGCYAPTPQAGAPCPDGLCPSGLVCSPATQTCEESASNGDASVIVDAPADAPADAQLIDGCTPALELCGDGVDQDCDGNDPSCATNDRAAGATAITGGGTFTADLRYAHDDVGANGCSGDGGRDLYYSITLSAPRVYYFDTFGSSFDTVVRVYAKACAIVGSGTNARACGNDSCSGAQTQLAVSLPAGDSCVVIDQDSGGETSGTVMLRVIAGSRDGAPLPAGMQTLSGDTAGASDVMRPQNCISTGGKDVAYFFMSCPAQSLLLDAETCNGADWDTALYVRDGNTTQITCNDDACSVRSQITNVPISGGPLFWLVVDGYDETESGAFTLKTNLR